MGKVKDYLETKVAAIVSSWDDATLEKHTIAKGDAALKYINNTSTQGVHGISAGREHDLRTDPGGFVYKSEIITKKAYFYQKPIHREIVFQHNTIMDAAIKKIKHAVTAVEPIFTIPNKEEEENPEEHEAATKGWKEIYGKEVLAKSLEKSIKHGIILYEPLKIPEKDLEWYTNAPFFIRSWDEINTRSEFKYGMATQYEIHPSNNELKGYTIDITIKKPTKMVKDDKNELNVLHTGLFFDPDNTDDHNGKPWFLGCWDNIIDYESIKEARNSYDEQIGNGFIVVGVPSKDYDKVKANVKAKIKNIRREQGLIIPINKDTPMAIEFKGSQFQIDFNADLNDIRRDIIANIGFPERWLFGDSEGAMESSGKDRMQVHDQIKVIFSKWKRFIKLILKYHGFISSLDEIEVQAPYELQLTESEKAEIDNLKAQTVGLKADFLTLDEIRDDLGKDPVDPSELAGAQMMTQNGEDNPDDNPLDDAKTGPDEEKTDGGNYSEDSQWMRKRYLRELRIASDEFDKAYDKFKQTKDPKDEKRKDRAFRLLKELEEYITKIDSLEKTDGNIFSKDKVMTKNAILMDLAVAYERWMHAKDPKEASRAKKMYMELLKYAEGSKKDAEEVPPYLLLDSIVAKTPYDELKSWFGVSRDTIAKIKRNMRDNQTTTVKTDSIMLDSVKLGPDIYSSQGLIVPTQKKYYPEFKSNFIRSSSQLQKAFDRQKENTFPLGVYQSDGHDEGSDVGEFAQFGEAKLDKVNDDGIYGTVVYDLTKVDEILGNDNWIRKRLDAKQKITTSVGLISTDIPIDSQTKYEINHKLKSFIATQAPRNADAGVD